MTPHALEPGRASRHAEALVEQHSVPPLHEAVGARGAVLGGAMFDPFHRGEQFVRMHFRTTAELATVVGKDRSVGNPHRLVEGEHPVVEQVAQGFLTKEYGMAGGGKPCRRNGNNPKITTQNGRKLKMMARPPNFDTSL